MAEADPAVAAGPLENRPGIFLVGSPNVGKRTILSRLLSIDPGDDAMESKDSISCHGWTIDTKYYSADVSIWTAQIDEGFSFCGVPAADQLVALVLVFDLNDLSSFSAVQDLVSTINITRFELLLCIGNKADLLPGHYAHVEYRRRLQNRGESSSDPHPEFLDYGILETEGTSLLGEEESSWEIRQSCLDWCIQHNIEYVEACGSNPIFDKCLSRHGDIQGVDRLYGALSAHMWPGMVLKSGMRVAEPFPLKNEVKIEESDDSEYEIEYEVLSGGFEEPWDDNHEPQVNLSIEEGSTSEGVQIKKNDDTSNGIEHKVSTSNPTLVSAVVGGGCDIHQDRVAELSRCGNSLDTVNDIQDHRDVNEVDESPDDTSSITKQQESGKSAAHHVEVNGDVHLQGDDLERLMSEIGNMRGSLRLMPDFQRREMAAKLAMKMAVMFGCSSDEEEGLE